LCLDVQIALLLATVAVTMVLFALERIPASVISLGVLLFLVISGLLPAEDAFAGFGSDVFLMILGIMIMTEALSRTGVTDAIGRWLLRRTHTGERTILAVVMADKAPSEWRHPVAAVVVGSFISNTASNMGCRSWPSTVTARR